MFNTLLIATNTGCKWLTAHKILGRIPRILQLKRCVECSPDSDQVFAWETHLVWKAWNTELIAGLHIFHVYE